MNPEQEKLVNLFMHDKDIASIINDYGEWNQTEMWKLIGERLTVLLDNNS